MKKTIFIASIFIGISLMIFTATKAAQVLNIRQGGSATSTISANDVLFGSSKGVFMTQDNNFSYATTTDTLTITNASTTNMTISTWLNSSTDRLPNAYFTNLDSTNATIGTLTLTSQMASGDLLVNGQGKFGTTATTTISGNNGTSDFSGNLTVNSTTATSTFSTGGLTVGTSQFVVQQTSGNVGIGTTSPTLGRLQVSQSADTVTSGLTVTDTAVNDAVYIWNDGTNARIDSSSNGSGKILLNGAGTGNVGIGTTGPSQLLHLYSISPRLFFQSSAGSENGIYFGNNNGSATGAILHNSISGNDINIYTGGVTSGFARLTILDTGNVGIGTTSPASLLHVSAGASATTTVEFGGQSTNAKTCFNVRDNLGAATSFYFSGTTMIVEANRCK